MTARKRILLTLHLRCYFYAQWPSNDGGLVGPGLRQRKSFRTGKWVTPGKGSGTLVGLLASFWSLS